MPFHMQPAQFPNGGYVNGDDRTPGSDQTYPIGTPVTYDTASHEVDEHGGGSTVTNVLGVSLEGVVAGVADNPSGLVGFAYARGNRFMAKLTNGSGVIQTVDEGNINVRYGMLKNGTGSNQWWSVDEADTTDVVLEVTGIDTELNVVFFQFIDSAVQNE